MLRSAGIALFLGMLYPTFSLASQITVRKGDTLSQIAERYNVRLNDLIYINQIKNSNNLQVGANLKLPKNKTELPAFHKVQRGETLISIAKQYGIKEQDLIRLNSIKSANYLYVGQTLSLPKINNNISLTGHTTSMSTEKSPKDKHIVIKGETLAKISRSYNIPMQSLININNFSDPNNLKVGTKVNLIAIKNTKENFFKESSKWKSYGPLKVDWANWKLMEGSHVAPSFNQDGKALYIAVNCRVKRINATNATGKWKKWSPPLERFEHSLISDLCKAKQN